jgi:hypothetical protein
MSWFSKANELLSGMKTYLVAIVAIVGALIGYVDHQLTLIQLLQAIWAAITAMTIRAAVKKSGPVKP